MPLSSTEAEYVVALNETVPEIKFIVQLLEDFGFEVKQYVLYREPTGFSKD